MPDQERGYVKSEPKVLMARAKRSAYIDPDQDMLPIEWDEGQPSKDQLVLEILIDLGHHSP